MVEKHGINTEYSTDIAVVGMGSVRFDRGKRPLLDCLEPIERARRMEWV
jgi:hypothetical protein